MADPLLFYFKLQTASWKNVQGFHLESQSLAALFVVRCSHDLLYDLWSRDHVCLHLVVTCRDRPNYAKFGIFWVCIAPTSYTEILPLHAQVLEKSKFLLLQTASPDAIVRLECTALSDEKDSINRIYLEKQHHRSIVKFLRYFVQNSETEGGLLLQVIHLLEQTAFPVCER